MRELSVISTSTLAARLRLRPLLTGVAVMASTLLSACASSPWYDNPPPMPGNASPPPGTLVSSKKSVLFVWDATAETESYDFHIFNAENSAIDQYMMVGLNPDEVCSGDTCSINLNVSLPDSDRHAWRVRSSNMAGKSAWTRTIFTFSSTGTR
ncbi:hypothetical protein [Granulosicoccus antarcticus]|uniref:Fibronectin type-III domain-containing protein n=1 Tax=Granulosicoccus antarcticus IMCC3135 TaxID=1192854 RepID=A0A2Z2P1Y1_9GAMM|nr:hypothetical protein [Granulosicoccus antarcticus]ASJ76258.1 hypothetical protein IMCC3135_31045 [Granulosicoccus antarcticus IMCC3135]